MPWASWSFSYGSDDEEVNRGRDRDEGDQRVQEVAVEELGAVDREREIVEARLAEDRRHDRGDEVCHQRLHQSRERGADHEGDGKLDQVATDDEGLEAAQDSAHAIPFARVAALLPESRPR